MDGSSFTATAPLTKADYQAGWHFVQLPGPTNIPERVLRAMHATAIDQRGAQFGSLALSVLEDMKSVFRTSGEVFIYPSSGSGAGEAAIANTLSPGDGILVFDSGQFSFLWIKMAKQFGLDVHVIENDWRRAPSPQDIEQKLRDDTDHAIKAVLVVHNETSTGTTARIPEIRRAIDSANHPALFMVDVISSLASLDFLHDDWGVDVAIAGSQKGLMLPPGLSFNAVSEKARKASETATLPRFYWDWEWQRSLNGDGFFPYTPAIQLFYGLRESLDMLSEEGLDNVISRHRRLGAATRAAVEAWGLDTVCADEREYSDSVTAVFVPDGYSADALRAAALDNFNMALGSGLARLQDRVFRIGHMGDCNEVMLLGVLSGIEMAMVQAGIPHKSGGANMAGQMLAAAVR